MPTANYKLRPPQVGLLAVVVTQQSLRCQSSGPDLMT